LSCLAVFGISFFIAIATFKGFVGFKNTSPLGLWIVYILWPLICTVIYVISQLILVFRTLEDRWPIGDIIFGTAFFTFAQVLLFAFSVTICNAIKHYIDGLFFFTLCMLLSVMMVYKYWDSITVRGSFLMLHMHCLISTVSASGRISSFPSALKRLCGRSKTHF
jgi:Chitin synthase export chaperone